MIVGDKTDARAQLSLTIIDYHEPFDQGFRKQTLQRECGGLVLWNIQYWRTIFTSSARAHGRVHVQNVRDFPQTELDSEINSPFLLNEDGDL